MRVDAGPSPEDDFVASWEGDVACQVGLQLGVEVSETPAQPADAAERDAGVPCPHREDGAHVLRYAEGDWYCWRCFATLRLGVWYPARNDGEA